MGKDEINDNILNSDSGTFLIRFSETYGPLIAFISLSRSFLHLFFAVFHPLLTSCPGQLAVGYADPFGNVKHYLIEQNELKKKSVAEFLNETPIFTDVLQASDATLFVLTASALASSSKRKSQSFARYKRKWCWVLSSRTQQRPCMKSSQAMTPSSIRGPLFRPVDLRLPRSSFLDGRKSVKTNTGAMKRNYVATDSNASENSERK